uniref:Ovule protein n=1 Tax=Heterorhabditis bacteriophora TaxID=37862 RepID=A0A1I7WYQ6_HETBA
MNDSCGSPLNTTNFLVSVISLVFAIFGFVLITAFKSSSLKESGLPDQGTSSRLSTPEVNF